VLQLTSQFRYFLWITLPLIYPTTKQNNDKCKKDGKFNDGVGQRVTFTTHPCLTPLLGRIPFEFLDETYPAKTRGMALLNGENSITLTLTVFDWSTHVTDRQTDGFAIAYSALSMLSRAKNENVNYSYVFLLIW